jgi:hypothetical protein
MDRIVTTATQITRLWVDGMTPWYIIETRSLNKAKGFRFEGRALEHLAPSRISSFGGNP